MTTSHAMAVLLLQVSVGHLVVGCVFPQDLNVLPPETTKRNTPPRILPTPRTPAASQAVVRAGSCSNRTRFELSIEDPDSTDRLESVWMLDSNFMRPYPGRTTRPTGSARATVTMSPLLESELLSLVDDKFHLIQVFVRDDEFPNQTDPFEPKTKEPEPLPDGGTFADTAYTVDTFWLVKVEACP